MPEICSRVCPQDRLCEGACILNACSDPVSIGAVGKFINEYAFAHEQADAGVAPPNGIDPVPIFAAGNSDKIDINKWGGVVVDSNQMTSVLGIFAGGDLARGPDLVVRAVNDSRKAAAGIHKYLTTK
jgi:NADPH-dependent glutamate synthase beta subunit-like oxidoreductase